MRTGGAHGVWVRAKTRASRLQNLLAILPALNEATAGQARPYPPSARLMSRADGPDFHSESEDRQWLRRCAGGHRRNGAYPVESRSGWNRMRPRGIRLPVSWLIPGWIHFRFRPTGTMPVGDTDQPEAIALVFPCAHRNSDRRCQNGEAIEAARCSRRGRVMRTPDLRLEYPFAR